MKSNSYVEKQERLDREHHIAWNAMSPSLKAKLAAHGVTEDGEEGRIPGIGMEEDAGVFLENDTSYSYTPDLAALVDSMADELAEQFSLPETTAQRLSVWVQTKVSAATEQTHSTTLRKVVFLLLDNPGSLLASLHGLLHACRLAESMGFTSLRRSAEVVGCSHEWLRKSALAWVSWLDLPPLLNSKSPEACAKYKADKENNHWRNQKATPQKLETLS